MRDVATLAGVGIKTVSRVINGEPNVSEAMSERVLRAAAALDYQPDVHAGSLKRGDRRTSTIGLLVSSVANPFDSQVHRAIEVVAAERGVAVFAASLAEDPENERTMVHASIRRRVDGLIITPTRPDQGYLAVELDRGLPVVFVDREPTGLMADAVVSDNVAGAAMATRHLLQRGHRRIAFLGDLDRVQTARLRRQGFLEEVGRAGVPTVDLQIITDLHDEESAALAATRVMSSVPPPTAIFSSQNLVTIGVVRALRELGLSRTVAVVGFDDIALGGLLDPPITVVAQDTQGIGTLAAQRLFARLDGDTSPGQTYVVPTTLIQRGSGEIPAPPR
ncbi:LacI family DNA-binding transcriptional regulator [Georgenia daeguensis]